MGIPVARYKQMGKQYNTEYDQTMNKFMHFFATPI